MDKENRPVTTTSYGKEIVNAAKIYTEKQKYGGTNKSLDYKLTIFYDICNQADVPQEAYLKAFPTMLKGLALDHFYTNQLSCLPFAKVCEHLWNFFKRLGFQCKNLDK